MSSVAEDESEVRPIEAKADPSITADLQAGHPREVLVMMSDQALRFRRASFAAKLPERELHAYLQGVKMELDAVKNRALAAAGSGATSLQSFDNLPLMHVRLDSPAALAALEAHPEVLAVVEDRALYAFGTATNLSLVGQPEAATAGDLGANTAVAVLDTGTDYTRAPFNCTAPGEPATCPVVYAKDFAKEDKEADSGNYHGTNVSGVVLAVAPSTKVIALDVFDGDAAFSSTVLSAIDWCIANKSKYNIVAINLSLGSGLYASACTDDIFASAVSAAKAAGILTAVASGNDASSDSIASPACVPGALAVGAVYDRNLGPLITRVCSDFVTWADKIACFSNSNPLLTVLAPGVGVTAAGITMSGTSQASPHVAGAIALLASSFPNATPDSLVARLITSRTGITDKRNKLTKPRLDLPAALGLVSTGSGGQGGTAGTGGSSGQGGTTGTGSSGQGGTTGTGGSGGQGGTAGTGGAGGTSSKPAVPSGKVAINNGDAFTRSPSVTVNVTTTSGTASQVCLSVTPTCSAWRSYVSSLPFTLSASDGKKTIYVWWKNDAGEASASPASASIVLDTTAPSNGVTGIAVSSRVATLGWSGFLDAGSGIASYRLVSASSALADCSRGNLLYAGSERSFKTAPLPTGITYFRVCAVDGAGNSSSGTASSVKIAVR